MLCSKPLIFSAKDFIFAYAGVYFVANSCCILLCSFNCLIKSFKASSSNDVELIDSPFNKDSFIELKILFFLVTLNNSTCKSSLCLLT